MSGIEYTVVVAVILCVLDCLIQGSLRFWAGSPRCHFKTSGNSLPHIFRFKLFKKNQPQIYQYIQTFCTRFLFSACITPAGNKVQKLCSLLHRMEVAYAKAPSLSLRANWPKFTIPNLHNFLDTRVSSFSSLMFYLSLTTVFPVTLRLFKDAPARTFQG